MYMPIQKEGFSSSEESSGGEEKVRAWVVRLPTLRDIF